MMEAAIPNMGPNLELPPPRESPDPEGATRITESEHNKHRDLLVAIGGDRYGSLSRIGNRCGFLSVGQISEGNNCPV